MAEPAGQQNTTSLSWRVRVCRAGWKVLLYVWGTLIVGMLVNIVSSWVIAKNFDLGGTPLGWGMDHLWAMLLLLFLLIVLTLLSWLGSHEVLLEPLHPLSQQSRAHMLRRLHRYYEQILTQSLQGVVQLELGDRYGRCQEPQRTWGPSMIKDWRAGSAARALGWVVSWSRKVPAGMSRIGRSLRPRGERPTWAP